MTTKDLKLLKEKYNIALLIKDYERAKRYFKQIKEIEEKQNEK